MKAAVYLRISLDQTGEQLAVERQREDCLRILRERGWTLADVYQDNSISATDASKVRPGYDRLVVDFEAGKFGALVCYDLDRLTRQPRQLEDWIDRAESGFAIITANGEADLTTDAGRLFARIKLAVARSEVERKGQRQRRAQQQRAEMGRPYRGGNRLTGYTREGEVIPEEALLVRTVYERFVAGDSLGGIARWLQAEGFKRRDGGDWAADGISGMLRNARYAGRSLYRGQDVGEAQWEAIVDPLTFSAVRARLESRSRGAGTNRERKWIGSGLYECECGRKMRGTGGSSGHRYTCASRCYYRTAGPIDELVLKTVRGRLGREDLVQLLADGSAEREMEELSAESRRLTLRMETIEADYDAELIDGRRFKVSMDKAREELTAVRERQARIMAGMGPLSVFGAADPVLAFDGSPLGVQQRVVDVLMRVTLHPVRRGMTAFDVNSVSVDWLTV